MNFGKVLKFMKNEIEKGHYTSEALCEKMAF